MASKAGLLLKNVESSLCSLKRTKEVEKEDYYGIYHTLVIFKLKRQKKREEQE